MSDRIAVMNGGKVEQTGSPREIYEHPQTAFVADFIGSLNVLELTIDEPSAHTQSFGPVSTSASSFLQARCIEPATPSTQSGPSRCKCGRRVTHAGSRVATQRTDRPGGLSRAVHPVPRRHRSGVGAQSSPRGQVAAGLEPGSSVTLFWSPSSPPCSAPATCSRSQLLRLVGARESRRPDARRCAGRPRPRPRP